jgi:hypothetical protein
LPITFDAGKSKSVKIWSHEGKVFLEVEAADQTVIIPLDPQMARTMGSTLRKMADAASRVRRQ